MMGLIFTTMLEVRTLYSTFLEAHRFRSLKFSAGAPLGRTRRRKEAVGAQPRQGAEDGDGRFGARWQQLIGACSAHDDVRDNRSPAGARAQLRDGRRRVERQHRCHREQRCERHRRRNVKSDAPERHCGERELHPPIFAPPICAPLCLCPVPSGSAWCWSVAPRFGDSAWRLAGETPGWPLRLQAGCHRLSSKIFW